MLGNVLQGVLRAPVGASKAILLVPAMGVPQSYYQSLADWLAQQGFASLSFDFVGIGTSRHGSLRRVQSDILAWAREDCAAALATLAAEVPGVPLVWLGHSLGGQILPLVPNVGMLSKAIVVATGSGYWRDNARALRWRAWLLWYLVVPFLTPLCGYFPGRRLRMVGDLPRGVIEQWRRWCL